MNNPNKPSQNPESHPLIDRRTVIWGLVGLVGFGIGLKESCLENPNPKEYLGEWGVDGEVDTVIEKHSGPMPFESKKLRCGQDVNLIMPILYTGTLVYGTYINGKKVSSIVSKVKKATAGIYDIEGDHAIVVWDGKWEKEVIMTADMSVFGNLKMANTPENCFEPQEWWSLEKISK